MCVSLSPYKDEWFHIGREKTLIFQFLTDSVMKLHLWLFSQDFEFIYGHPALYTLQTDTPQIFSICTKCIKYILCVGVHIFGLCITALITDIIQLSTGYHAPYFLTVCKPNYTILNTTCDDNSFIVEDICSGSDSAAINAGRLESLLNVL